MTGCIQIDAVILLGFNCKNIKTDKKGRRWENFSARSISGCAGPAISVSQIASTALEMGKKLNASVNTVGKKLRHFEEYIPLNFWNK